MTKEQAIKIIRRYECNSEHYEACEIAIKALEQSSYNSIKTELKPCEDAISRRAVIDGINRYFHDEYYQRTSIQDCRDCLIEDVINKLPAVNPQPSGDLISRQSAIFLASDLKQDLPDDERIADMVMAHNEGVSEYQTQLSLLPFVNPQPKTAHWVNGEYCSNCGCDIPAYIIDWKWQKDMDAKYCPNCGRRMIKPQAKSEENKI